MSAAVTGAHTGAAHRIASWLDALVHWRGDHILALMDQGVVSAASFLTTVIISRYADAAQLGAYAIGISILASVYTLQGQLISLPYSIQRHRPIGAPEQRAGGALVLAGLLAALVTLLLAFTALSLLAGGAQAELVAVTWALVGVMPFALLRDFFRRFAFTHLEMAKALIIDASVAALQLSILGWLGWTGRMSAVTASVALGVSCGIVAIGCLIFSRARFRVRPEQTRTTMDESWKLGKWLLVNQMMVQSQRFSAYWLLVMIAGATATGVYTACMSIVAFTNPLFFGLNNLFTQKSVLAWQRGGGATLRYRAFRDFMLLGAALGPFCLLALWFGEDVMHFLYRGREYVGYGHVIPILAFATLAFALGTPAGNALASMERPRVVFIINAVGAVITVLVVWRSLALWGLAGAAYGWLLSNTIVALALWVGFVRVVGRLPDDTPARKVLDEFFGASNPPNWTITYLGEGDHSNVYAVRSKDGGPIWQTKDVLVLKLFKPEAQLPIDMAYAQANSLLRLCQSINGSEVNGWTMAVPMPLYVCEAPFALVMTAVPGKDLKSNTATDDDLTPEVLQSMGRTLVAVMRRNWSHGQIHGDIGLQNILYDLEKRQLALIDPGTPECCIVCMELDRRWKPEILELGHIVRDLGTDIRDLTGHSAARLRRKVFTESALRAMIETIHPAEERRRALKEIFDCAIVHLSKVIQASWPLRTFFAGLLTRFVAHRINAVLSELKDSLESINREAEKTPPIALPDFE